MNRAPFRILIAAANPEYRKSLRELTDAATALVPSPLEVAEASSLDDARAQLAAEPTDAVLVDWSLAADGTLDGMRRLLAEHPDLRVLLLLPSVSPEYRRAAWSVGACACVPRERIDPEWLQAILCVMDRAREREARIRARVA